MTAPGFVTGLAIEARILRRAARGQGRPESPLVACAGADSERARRLADELVGRGAGVLISFGLAGGLHPEARPGELLLPEEIALPAGQAIATDAAWRARLAGLAGARGLPIGGGTIGGSDVVVVARAEKRRLFERHGARAVDMESHAVAVAARRAGLPVVVIRAVADPAERSLPQAVLGAVSLEGHSRGGRVAARLCLRPWELPRVLRLQRDAAAGLTALDRFAAAAGTALFGGL